MSLIQGHDTDCRILQGQHLLSHRVHIIRASISIIPVHATCHGVEHVIVSVLLALVKSCQCTVQSDLSRVTDPPMVESWAPVTGHNDLYRISTSGAIDRRGGALTRAPYMVVIGRNPTFVICHTSCRRILQAVWSCHASQALSN